MPVVISHTNVYGLGPVSTSPNKTVEKCCKIVEEFNCMVKDNYKLKLYPEDYDETTYRYEDYYVSDLVSVIRSGFIKIV